MGERAHLYFVKATSRLGHAVQSGPWSAGWICKKAISYERAGFSDVLVVELGATTEIPLQRFLSDHPTGKNFA